MTVVLKDTKFNKTVKIENATAVTKNTLPLADNKTFEAWVVDHISAGQEWASRYDTEQFELLMILDYSINVYDERERLKEAEQK